MRECLPIRRGSTIWGVALGISKIISYFVSLIPCVSSLVYKHPGIGLDTFRSSGTMSLAKDFLAPTSVKGILLPSSWSQKWKMVSKSASFSIFSVFSSIPRTFPIVLTMCEFQGGKLPVAVKEVECELVNRHSCSSRWTISSSRRKRLRWFRIESQEKKVGIDQENSTHYCWKYELERWWLKVSKPYSNKRGIDNLLLTGKRLFHLARTCKKEKETTRSTQETSDCAFFVATEGRVQVVDDSTRR